MLSDDLLTDIISILSVTDLAQERRIETIERRIDALRRLIICSESAQTADRSGRADIRKILSDLPRTFETDIKVLVAKWLVYLSFVVLLNEGTKQGHES
jgi:hypothetical protein